MNGTYGIVRERTVLNMNGMKKGTMVNNEADGLSVLLSLILFVSEGGLADLNQRQELMTPNAETGT